MTISDELPRHHCSICHYLCPRRRLYGRRRGRPAATRDQLLTIIQDTGPVSRNELIRQMGKSRVYINTLIYRARRAGATIEFDRASDNYYDPNHINHAKE